MMIANTRKVAISLAIVASDNLQETPEGEWSTQ